MPTDAITDAFTHVREDDPDDFMPLETLANLAGALRRATEPRVGGRHLNSAAQAAGLAAELARECGSLRGNAVNLAELEEAVRDAAAREKAAHPPVARPAYGPAAYAAAQEKAEDLIRGYARGLRQSNGESLWHGALSALEAEAVGLAGQLANVIDQERADQQ